LIQEVKRGVELGRQMAFKAQYMAFDGVSHFYPLLPF